VQAAPLGLVEPRKKPEPVTVTDVPGDPEVGEKTTLGTTVNVLPKVVDTPPGVDTTLIVYVPYVDPVPTLKLADVIPPAPFSVHAITTTFSTGGASQGT